MKWSTAVRRQYLTTEITECTEITQLTEIHLSSWFPGALGVLGG